MSDPFDLTPVQRVFWDRFLDSVVDRREPSARFFEAFAIGSTPENADEGARLILSGKKTATSDAVARLERAGDTPPFVGALSLLLDGRGAPVAVVETIEVEIRRFNAVDAAFASDYGEWDGTLETWRQKCAAFYTAQAATEGWKWSDSSELVCERMRVVFRA